MLDFVAFARESKFPSIQMNSNAKPKGFAIILVIFGTLF